jgi:hypothetical protein
MLQVLLLSETPLPSYLSIGACCGCVGATANAFTLKTVDFSGGNLPLFGVVFFLET